MIAPFSKIRAAGSPLIGLNDVMLQISGINLPRACDDAFPRKIESLLNTTDHPFDRAFLQHRKMKTQNLRREIQEIPLPRETDLAHSSLTKSDDRQKFIS